MLKVNRIIVIITALCGSAVIAQAQCPGYNPNPNTNLACAIATSAPAQVSTIGASSTLASTVGSTMATQLSQLPIATTVSGAGLIFNPQLGVFEASKDLGPILTQRGDTIGRHKVFLSFTYQRFSFSSIDDIDLKNLQVVNTLTSGGTTFLSSNSLHVDFRVDQFVGVVTMGLTNRIDFSVIVPFSQATLKSQRTSGNLYTLSGGTLSGTTPLLTNYFAGSAFGLGDMSVGVKANIYKSSSEKTSIAIGGLVRFPSGDAFNFLGTGAYGVKPYFVISHRGRITPNINLAYQWNGVSALNVDPATGKSLNLPSSFMYSAGADLQVNSRLSVSAEFLGQVIINGPRLSPTTVPVPGTSFLLNSVAQADSTYAMNNEAFGFKLNPFKGLMISGSVLVKLDNAGLRAKAVPLVGIAYRF